MKLSRVGVASCETHCSPGITSNSKAYARLGPCVIDVVNTLGSDLTCSNVYENYAVSGLGLPPFFALIR
jgi:hypothetical protein